MVFPVWVLNPSAKSVLPPEKNFASFMHSIKHISSWEQQMFRILCTVRHQIPDTDIGLFSVWFPYPRSDPPPAIRIHQSSTIQDLPVLDAPPRTHNP